MLKNVRRNRAKAEQYLCISMIYVICSQLFVASLLFFMYHFIFGFKLRLSSFAALGFFRFVSEFMTSQLLKILTYYIFFILYNMQLEEIQFVCVW